MCASGGRSATLAEEIVHIDALLSEQRAGAYTIDGAVERFVTERGITEAAPFVERYKRMAMDCVDVFFVPEADARSTLLQLRKRGVPYAILSNGWSPLQQHKAASIGFDGPILVSDILGVQKPASEAFALLASALGTAAAETAYVGDNPLTDVAPAIAAGQRGVWFDTENAPYPSDLPAPSAVIHRLTELLALL